MRSLRSLPLDALPALALLGAALLGCGGDGTPARGQRGSGEAVSLLLVTLDTTRADHLSPYGAAAGATPNLEELADDGVVFERAFAVAPTTVPAHGSMMTGLEPAAHGIRQNGLHVLDPTARTLAELLGDRGYATAAFVSAAVLARGAGLERGFTTYDDTVAAAAMPGDRVDERRAADTVDAAIAWLASVEAGPFFLWVHLFDPHAPYAPPAEWAARFPGRPYAAEIAYLDAQVGRLLAQPRIGDETLVVALGDHGESLGEHGERGHGLLLYDTTLHVPWILRGPEITPGRRLAGTASQVDLLPTVLDLLGVKHPEPGVLPGRSWAPALTGEGEPPPRRQLYAETFHPYFSYGWAPLRSLREDGLKLIEAPTPELYDTARDPAEDHELFAERRRDGARLRQALLERLADDRGPAAAKSVDESTAESLEALGYVARSGAGGERRRLDPKEVIHLHYLIEEGREALFRLDAATAAERFLEVLESDPHNLIALERGGVALAHLGRFDEAKDLVTRALDTYPEVDELWLVAAQVHSLAGDPAAALAAAERAMAAAPGSVAARVEAASALAALGRSAEAEAQLDAALDAAPADARAQILWARQVALPQGRAAAAIDRLAPLLADEGHRYELWHVLGLAYEAAGRRGEAEATYRRGLELHPAAGMLHAQLGLLLAQQGDDGAREHLRRAERLLRPVPAIVPLAEARLAAARGEWEAVERAARTVLRAEPDAAEAWLLLAAAEEERGRVAQALAAYGEAIERAPGEVAPRFNLALLLRRTERYGDSAARLREVLRLAPDHAGAHYELGLLYGGPLGDPAAARRHLEQARAAGHPRPELIARLLRELGAA